MIRKAEWKDLDAVEQSYVELLLHEKEHGAYTVWELGVYPTRATAEQALDSGALYVLEQDGELYGSIIIDQVQPGEYSQIEWPCRAEPEEVLVVHLLCVRPSKAGRGAGRALVEYAAELGKRRRLRAVRLDTGAQNTPAVALYQKLGFELAGSKAMAIGGVIAHKDHLFFEKRLSG